MLGRFLGAVVERLDTLSPRSNRCPPRSWFRMASRLKLSCNWPPARAGIRRKLPLSWERSLWLSLHWKTGAIASSCQRKSTRANCSISVGDLRQVVQIRPMFRPELTAIAAEVTLPAYLGRTTPVVKDALRRRDRAGQGKPRALHGHDQSQSRVGHGRWQAANARRRLDCEPNARRSRAMQDRVPLARRIQPRGQGAVHAFHHAL